MWDVAVRVVAGLASMGLAIGLGCYVRRLYPSWKAFGWGALCFVLSQVLHIPFNALVLNKIFDLSDLMEARGWRLLFVSIALGLSAGIFEETTRWIFYRYKFREAKSYELALMFGAGHGGCEAIIVGYLAIMALIGMVYLRAHPQVISDMPQDEQQLLAKPLADYWASSALMVLMAPVERIFAMTFHLCASVLVWQGFVQNDHPKFWGLAVAAHTALDAAAVFLLVTLGAYAVEICLLLIAFPMSVYVIWYYRPQQDADELSSDQDGLILSSLNASQNQRNSTIL